MTEYGNQENSTRLKLVSNQHSFFIFKINKLRTPIIINHAIWTSKLMLIDIITTF